MYYKSKKFIASIITLCFLLTQIVIACPVIAQSAGSGRIAGVDRYQTAVATSQKGWKTANYAVLARGDDFADALCAGPLAYKNDGPILLTEPNILNQDTLAELKRLGVNYLFIVGGVGAVSQNVEDAIKAAGITDVERIYGDTRYDTSVKIAEKLGASNKIVLATGNNFPDALSISVIASKLAMPILLTEKDSIPTSVNEYIQGKSITQTYIVGGSAVISAEVEKLLPGPSRLAGNDRYQTNIEILKNFENSINFETIYVAIGTQFADALTGAVLAAKNSSPLILTGDTLPTVTADYLKSKVLLTTKVTGLGGQAVVPSSILNGIMAYKSDIAVSEKYDKAGSYGPDTGSQTVSGSVIISAADVTLHNTIIEGDLLLAQSIGDGNITLKDVTVKGKTIVNGGGPHSVIMYNFNGQTVVVDLPDGSNVRLVAQGSTSIVGVTMESDGTLEEAGSTGSGFVDVSIPAGVQVTFIGAFAQVSVEASGANVTVASGSISTMTIAENATGTGVNLANGTSITTLNANGASNITGQGQITTANVNTSNVTIEQTPTNTTVVGGITASVGGEIVTGTNIATPSGGGGGWNNAVAVSAINVTGATAPITGATPVTAVTPHTQYTGTVVWSGTPVNFAASTAYTATITLTAKAGYTLTGVIADQFTIDGATATNAVNSGVITVLFPATAAPDMTGTVAITGTEKFGQLLTAVPTLSNAGTPTYQWNRGGVAITGAGATASSYTLVEADIAQTITVTAKADGVAGTGFITSAATGTIAKADGPAAPGAPTLVSKTSTSVTLTANALHQFSRDAGTTWQDSEVFTGLTTSTTYTFTARVKETTTHLVSNTSPGTAIMTEAPGTVVNLVAIPGVVAPVTGAAPVTTAIDTAQYSGTITWDPVANPFAPTTNYTANIELTAKAGFTLTGVTENSFTVAGATQVTNAVNTGIITAVFRTAPLPTFESITSKAISNLNYLTIQASGAKIVSKTITSSDFRSPNNKSFRITDEKGDIIPVNLSWNVVMNEYTPTFASAVGSAIESSIQDYEYAKYGVNGLVTRPLYASYEGENLYISTFATGASAVIKLDGADWTFFFGSDNVKGIDYNNTANRSFTISDGTKTVSINLTRNFTDMTSLVTYLNGRFVSAGLKAIVQRVDDNYFKIIGNPGVHLIIGGTNSTDFFN